MAITVHEVNNEGQQTRARSILDRLPEIVKAEVTFKVEGKEIGTGFTGFVNKFNRDEEDARYLPIKQVKSIRYQELDHRVTVGKVLTELEAFKEELRLHQFTANAEYSVVKTAFILDKPFKLSHVPFEENFGNRAPDYYTGEGDNKVDEFYPLITVVNSFLGCSTVSFNLYRRKCSNGLLFGEVFGRKIAFRHFGDVAERFNKETESFLSNIFEKRFVERVFEEYNAKEISKQDLVEFSGQTLGSRISKELNEGTGTFNQLPSTMSYWVALQIISWYTTHKVKDQYKAVNALKRLHMLKGGIK